MVAEAASVEASVALDLVEVVTPTVDPVVVYSYQRRPQAYHEDLFHRHQG